MFCLGAFIFVPLEFLKDFKAKDAYLECWVFEVLQFCLPHLALLAYSSNQGHALGEMLFSNSESRAGTHGLYGVTVYCDTHTLSDTLQGTPVKLCVPGIQGVEKRCEGEGTQMGTAVPC